MNIHSFHIPVLGLAFSVDTPIKVAHLGIDSVMSIVEDSLLEQVRKFYSEKHGFKFQPITNKVTDARAKRITQYLNLVKKIAEEKFARFKKSCSLGEAIDYFGMLPDASSLKKQFLKLKEIGNSADLINYVRNHAKMGSIDVNIMTKLDRVNFKGAQPLGKEYNDAHAALRGFAKSELQSSLILSAGLNPSLYSYMASFDDFFPDERGVFRKKIILKVSDYRSALIQGKFLAKKGLWVSEFRIESGLNCGGHAFATDGHLMGPILEEFNQNRAELRQTLFDIYATALEQGNRPSQIPVPEMKISAQGGVGTADEHTFLQEQYGMDAVGWGSPFLLVPEATCVDRGTRERVRASKEKDLYLSEISPLGVSFNNLRDNTKDLEKEELIRKGKPGSPCIKKYLAFNTEYSKKPLCTASRKYQHIKIKELEENKLPPVQYQREYRKITEKACICTGLSTPFLLENELETGQSGEGVSICPGPNIAYFTELVSLRKMIDHIYGRANIITRNDRPHMFIKELGLYMDHFKKLMDEYALDASKKVKNRVSSFVKNLEAGIAYYQQLDLNLSNEMATGFRTSLKKAQSKLELLSHQLCLEAV
ncbi:MAG: hypothetical protein ABJE80_14075 [Reichenbachiella sp.]|uniref:hypothetical protein n=1 Tax=Reichenbachiella sp. TaxID=2184521 RepID=UPI0032670886